MSHLSNVSKYTIEQLCRNQLSEDSKKGLKISIDQTTRGGNGVVITEEEDDVNDNSV